MSSRYLSVLLVPFFCFLPAAALAQGKAALTREMVEFVFRKFAPELAGESVESLSGKLGAVVAKYGDDGFTAVKNVGPSAFRLIEEAGENGLKSVRLMAKFGDQAVWVVGNKGRLAIFVKYGDDAAEAMIKHGEIAEPLIGKFGESAAMALKGVSPQNARRIAMLEDTGELAAMGRTDELLQVVSKYGDSAMDFIWKNKGSLAVTAAMTAFLLDPKPFIDGSTSLASDVGRSVMGPLAEGMAKGTNWTVIFLVLIGCVSGWLGFRAWRKDRPKPPQGESASRA
jgi:hypothetical protein